MSSSSPTPQSAMPALNEAPSDSPSELQTPPTSQPRAMGEPRGEEFDLSRLPAPETAVEEGAPRSKWNRGWLVLAGILTAYCFYFWVYGLGVRAQKPLPLGPVMAKHAGSATVRVHVAGAVVHPGVYSLATESRVADALQKAGGATPDADPNALNLAGFVEDGAKISVPLKAAPTPNVTPTPVVIVREVPVPAPATSPETAPKSSTLAPAANPVSGSSSAPSTPLKKSDNLAALRAHPVDLNHATSAQLQQLPGVGPKMAERILAYRSENGRFKSVADLDNVRGFGEKKMDALKDLVVVR